jgi:hypothetical protein
MSAPSDVLADVQRQNQLDALQQKKLNELDEKNSAFATILQHNVYKNSNPNPIVIVVVVIIFIFIIWYLYCLLQPSIVGSWCDQSGNKFTITKESDKIKITNDTTTVAFTGVIKQNMLDLEGGFGLWDGENKIILPENLLLTRIMG